MIINGRFFQKLREETVSHFYFGIEISGEWRNTRDAPEETIEAVIKVGRAVQVARRTKSGTPAINATRNISSIEVLLQGTPLIYPTIINYLYN